MITKMKKLTFLVFYKEYKEFLDRMGELGVLHVIEKQQGALDNAEVQEQMRLLSRYAAAIEALQKVEAASSNPSQGGELGSAMPESPLLGRGRGEAPGLMVVMQFKIVAPEEEAQMKQLLQ